MATRFVADTVVGYGSFTLSLSWLRVLWLARLGVVEVFVSPFLSCLPYAWSGHAAGRLRVFASLLFRLVISRLRLPVLLVPTGPLHVDSPSITITA